jgi:hypothetical protein
MWPGSLDSWHVSSGRSQTGIADVDYSVAAAAIVIIGADPLTTNVCHFTSVREGAAAVVTS